MCLDKADTAVTAHMARAHMADTAGMADTANQGITAGITAVLAVITMDGVGAGNFMSSGADGVSWLIWSSEKIPTTHGNHDYNKHAPKGVSSEKLVGRVSTADHIET